MPKDEINIKLNKSKLLFGIGGSLLFLFLGIFLFTSVADQQTRFNPLLIKGIGILNTLFFGATGLFGIKKMFDKKIGLKIDSYGITDNSNATSIGLIIWNDITEIRVVQIMSTKFIMVDVKNPEKYIDKAKGKFKSKLMQSNLSKYGSPISITSNTLVGNIEEIATKLQHRLKLYKNTV